MKKQIIIFPILVFFLYFVVSIFVLTTGHLHEDAYILYIFSESFANGNGIAYFPGGSPAEGATDFLWMIILGLGHLAGIDVAIIATILNGIGLSIITFISILIVEKRISEQLALFAGLMLATLIISSQVSQASLAGFSASFYCAVTAICFYLLFQRDRRYLHLIPCVGIILGLLRPDGVILGITASLIGLVLAQRDSVLRKYIAVSIACFLVGSIYFIWRYIYFGNLLPLPLYVKSTSVDSLPGLWPHIQWGLNNKFLVLLAIGSIFFCKERGRILVASLPVAALFIALFFATQSQNVAYRFQAPGTTLLLMWAALFLSDIFAKFKSALETKKYYSPTRTRLLILIALSTVLATTVTQARDSLRMVSYLQNNQYINFFPYHLSKTLNATAKIALTEAGRFAYWMEGEKYDLVGLNTPEVARQGSSPLYIEEINPDLIFIHVARSADYSGFCDKHYCQLSKSEVFDGITDRRDWQNVAYGVHRAPLTVYEFYKDNADQYIAFIVMYDNRYSHLYLVKKNGLVDIQNFMEALDLSFSESGRLSYLEMKRQTEYSSVFQ